MPTISVNVSDETMPRLREEATARGFATPEDYLQDLLAEALGRKDEEALEAVLLERLDSGQVVNMDDADFRALREQAAARVAGRRAP